MNQEQISKKLRNILDLKFLVVIFCFIVSFCTLTICTKNSPLYSFNDWVDGNAFFTMGKGIANGLVPYKDLFEQKGPLLYLIYAIGYLISNDSFLGVYILEIISSTVFAYYLFKISREFVDCIYSYIATALTLALLFSSTQFVQGGSAEEFCLPLIAFSLYSFIHFINLEISKPYHYLINGIVAGLISLIKFNLLGLWFIWMACNFFYLIYKKEIKNAFHACLYFLCGMFIPIMISIIVFALVGGLKDYLDVYIFFNIRAYTTNLTLTQRINNMFHIALDQSKYSLWIHVLTIMGFIGMFSKIYTKRIISIFVILSFLFLLTGIYIGGNPYIYYYLSLSPYIIFGFIALFYCFENLLFKNAFYKQLIIILVGMVMFYNNAMSSGNLAARNLQKDDFVQYQFAKIINKDNDHTLLNYAFLDGGFYTAANIVPNVKYFMLQNVDYNKYPMVSDSQNMYISEKKTNYIVVREYFANIGYHRNIPNLNENYKLISEKKTVYEGMDITYFLYKRK